MESFFDEDSPTYEDDQLWARVWGACRALMAYSGLRWSEAVALKRTGVDPMRRRVHVREAATEVGGRIVVGTPKNHRGRTVILPGFISDRLADHLGSLAAESDPPGLVFRAPASGFLRVSNFRRAVWLPAVKAAGIEPGLRVHDLRHTTASLAVSAGASIKAVQTMLGHSSAVLTLNRYAHLYEDDLEALADAVDKRFAQSDVAQVWPKPPSGVVALRS